MPKPSNAYVPRKGAAGKTYTNADGKKVKHYSVGEDDKKKAGSGERPAPIVPGKSFTKTGPTTVSDRTVEPERSRAKEQAFKESRMDFTPAAKRTTGKTYQEQQNEKNMMGSGGAVKPGQRNPSYVESKPAAPETEKPEEPRRTVQYETGTPAFLETPIPALPPMNYLTGDMDKQVQQMYRDHQRQDIREMPDQLYDIGKPFPNTVKPGQMNGSYTKISDKEPDNRPYRERINSLQDDLTEEVRQRQWMEQANAEYSQARADALHELNMEDIWAMPIEDREELRKYVDADVERRARMGASGPIEFYARDKAASEAFAPLEEKYGEQRAKELAEAMEWYLSEKETERVREYGEKLGHGNFAQKVGGNVLSIAANTAGSITGPMGYLDEAIHRTGQYPMLNPNNMGMTPGVYAGAVREATAQDIEGENGNWFRKGLSYAYQGTMSAADSLARLAVAGEAGGLALAGLGQFGSAVSEASARGASPGQAVCYGVTTASVEVLTEKIPMDDWLKIAKGGKQPLTVAVKNAFKQAGVEITTEEISFVADLMLDATIMQGKSGYNQQVRELEAQGYSRTDAENMASKALLWEAFDTLMASGFSGGGSSVVGSVIANVTDSGTQQEAKAGAEQAGQNAVRDVQSMTDEALGVQQPQIPPARQEQDAGPQQGPQTAPEATIPAQQPQADLQRMTDDAMGVQREGQPQIAPEVQAQQQAAANQEMIDRTADALYQPRAEAPVQQTAEDVRSAANEVLGVEEPAGPEKMDVDDGETYLSRKEKGERYKQSKVNAAILDMVNRVKNGIAKAGEKIRLAPISDKNAARIQQETGVDVRGYDTVIEARQIDHILKRHGENGIANHTMADPMDIARIEYALENPDRIVKSEPTRAYVSIKDGKNKPADTVLYETLLEDGSYYVVQAVPDTKKHTLYVLTAYIGESSIQNEAPRFSGTTNPILTSETQDTITSDEAMQSSDAGNYEDTSGASTNIVTPDTNNVNGKLQEESLSAAKEGFTGKQGYYDLLTDENAQRDRPGDVRPMEMPKTDINGGKVSEVTGNVYGSKITTDEMANLMEKPTAKGYFSYVQISNDQASQMAMNTIAAGETWDNAFDSWKSDVDKGKAGAEMSARAAFLLNHFAEIGDKKQWLKTLHYTQMLGTNTAQGLQALRLIRELNPQDKVAFTRMTIQRAVTDLTQKYKTAINMEGAEPLLQALEQAETDEQRDVIIEGLQKHVADQVPSTILDKFTALRYTNMLGNLKTVGRNVAGNVAMAAQYRIKDTIAAGMEQIANVLTDGKVKKTKSVTVGKDLMNACRQDFQQFSSIVSDGGKYGDRVSGKNQFMQGVEEKRTIFKTKLVEAYRKGTNWAMNNQYFGDEAFGREGYARALAGYLKANGVKDADLSKVDGKLMDEARAYAIQQAQEATFHDYTALARVLSKLQKDTGVVGQGIIPFVKTPANVLVRGEEFSPLGFINSTVKTIEGIQGKATGAEIIDSWAKTLTGTGLFALGAFLKSQGWIIGGPDDDEDKENFDKMNGNQPYSLNLPWGGSYTMDWLNPTGIPLFMGAQFQNLFSKDYKDITFADLEEVFTSVADPMIQMSILQGLNDSLDNIKYSGNNLGQFFLNAGVSYLTQGLQNTMLGQIEKSFEKERTYTYVDKDSQVPAWMQKTLGKVSQKFPGLDYHQVPYRNGWGEKEEQPTGAGGMAYNMLSPGYYKAGNEDPVNKELQRLNEEEGLSSDIFPGFQVKKMTWTDGDGIEHKDYNMDAREADRFQETAGKTAHTIVSELLKKEEFKALSPGDKERAIKNAYDYAQEKGREEALDGYQVTTSWMQGVDEENAVDKILARSWSGQNRETTFSDKVQKEMDALEASVPEAKGISEKEIPETATVAGEEELLSLEQRQQYAEVYDKKVNEYCDALVSDPGFQQLSGEGKTEALKKAKEYAADHAKAAVSDFSDVQKGFGRDVAVRIVNDVALKSITDIFGDIDTNTKKGSSNADNIKALDAAYDQVSELPDMQRDKVLGDAESDAAIYFDARGSGVGTWDFIQARDAVNSAPGSGSVDKDTGKPKQTNADKYGAIAGLERMTDETIDSLMKAWMPDYDPDNGKTDRAELKYDYARKELRLSPSQYAEAYRVNSQYSLKGDKKDAWKAMGLSDSTAEMLYKLLGGHDEQFNQKLVELYGG